MRFYFNLFYIQEKNVQRFRRYHPDKQSLTFRNFTVTLTVNTVIQFFHSTLRLLMLYYQTKSKIVNQFLIMTLHLMIIHHHTKFGSKRFRRYHLDKIGQKDRQMVGGSFTKQKTSQSILVTYAAFYWTVSKHLDSHSKTYAINFIILFHYNNFWSQPWVDH